MPARLAARYARLHCRDTAALLDATGITLSVAAFRRLGPSLRRRFKKHTASVTYIRAEDPRRPGRAMRR